MAEIKVFFPLKTEFVVKVPVDDPADSEQLEAAIYAAYDLLPEGDYTFPGNGPWSVYIGATDLEAQYATDDEDEVIWGEMK